MPNHTSTALTLQQFGSSADGCPSRYSLSSLGFRASALIRGFGLRNCFGARSLGFARVFVFGFWSLALIATQTHAAPTSQPTDTRLWAELQQIDAKSARIDSVTADFEQRKYTVMMKKPLLSSGHVSAAGNIALWQTDKPQPTRMLVNPKEIRIYYPNQGVVEIYPVQGQLGALAASPLPRLQTLQTFFTFDRDSAPSLDKTATDDKFLAVRLTPSNDELRQHVKQVRVLLDRNTGAIRLVENTDTDGDRTVMIFSQMKLGTALPADALQLSVPPGTKQANPLEGLQDGSR